MTFRIKIRYYLELLTPETMELFGSTENKINKDKNDENVPHLETMDVVLVQWNNYQQDSRILYTFVPNKVFGSLLEISSKNYIFLKHLIQNFKLLKYGLQTKIVKH